MAQTQAAAATMSSVVAAETQRLESCHPVFKLSPPPVHTRVVWTQPFDVKEVEHTGSSFTLEFTIQYAQSASFKTEEEASKTEAFTPLFNTAQRNHYVVQGNQIKIAWRESYLHGKWTRDSENPPEFACWQKFPATR